MTLRGLIFPVALCASVVLHAWALGSTRWSVPLATGGDPVEIVTEVVLIEESPPPPEPPPPEEIPETQPESQPEPIPQQHNSLPPAQEILTAPGTEAAPLPPPPHPPKSKPKTEPKPPSAPKTPSAPKLAEAPKPVVISNSPPRYPEFARRKGWEGRVFIRVSVDTSGRPIAVAVAQSSGYSVLDQAALQTVKTWRFRPRVAGGRAEAGTVDVPVNFSLRR